MAILIESKLDPTDIGAGSPNKGQVLAADPSLPNGLTWADANESVGKIIPATDAGIDRPFSSDTMDFPTPTLTEGLFHYIGTEGLTQAWTNPVTAGFMDLLYAGIQRTHPVDQSTANNGTQNASLSDGEDVVIDLINPSYFAFAGSNPGILFGYATVGVVPSQLILEGSNDNISYAPISIITNAEITSNDVFVPITNSNFYRYYRLTWNRNGSASTTAGMREIEFYGTVASPNPVYQLVEDNRGGFLDIGLGGPTQVDIPTGFEEGWYAYITVKSAAATPVTINPLPGVTLNGNNLTLNQYEAALLVHLGSEQYIVHKIGKAPLLAKGNLLSSNGINDIELSVGTNGQVLMADDSTTSGLAWENASSITGTFSPTANLNSSYPLVTAGTFNDILNAIGTDDNTVAFSNPVADNKIEADKYNLGNVTPLGTIQATNLNIADHTLANPGDTLNSGVYVIDFKANSVNITDIAVYTNNATGPAVPLDIYVSDSDTTSWTFLGTVAGTRNIWTTLSFTEQVGVRYIRFESLSGGGRDVYEVEVYGSVSIPGAPINYNLSKSFNTKYVEFTGVANEFVVVDIDSNSGIDNELFSTVLHCNNGNLLTLNPVNGAVVLGDLVANDGETLVIYKAGVDKFISLKSNTILEQKGNILTSDGVSNLQLNVGTNGQVLTADSSTASGLAWEIVSPITGTFSPTPELASTYVYDTFATDGIINAIATEDNTTAFVNPLTAGRIDSEWRDGPFTTNTENLFDQNLSSNVLFARSNGNTGYFQLDFLANAVNLDTIGIRLWETNVNADLDVQVDNGSGYVTVGTVSTPFSISNEVVQFPKIDNVISIRIRDQSTASNNNYRGYEVEVWGDVSVPGAPINYTLNNSFKSKLVEFTAAGNEIVKVDLDTNSNISATTFFTVLHCNNGSNLTLNPINGAVVLGDLIANDGETLVLYKAGADKFVSVKSNTILSAKGNLLTSDGTDEVQLTVGTDGQILVADSTTPEGIKWSDDKPIQAQEASLDNGIITTFVDINTPDLIDLLYAQNGNNNPNPTLLTIGSTLGATDHGNLTNTSTVNPGVVFDGSNRETFIDLLGSTLSCTHAAIRAGFNGNSVVFQIFGSNNGTSWTTLGTFPGTSGPVDIPIANNTPFSYFRFRTTTTATWNITEIELFGTYISATPSRSIVPADLNKVNYLNIAPSATFNLTIPDSTGQWSQGDYYSFVNTGLGKVNIILGSSVSLQGSVDNVVNFTLVNLDGADSWLIVKDAATILNSNTKGSLITSDGTENIELPVGSDNSVLIADSGEASGLAWTDINTIVNTPFSSERLDPTGNTQLTASNARYLYISSTNGPFDVILTDPPSTNDFFYIVNRDEVADINIKEVAAGSVIQTLNSLSPSVQCHYDGVEWQVI